MRMDTRNINDAGQGVAAGQEFAMLPSIGHEAHAEHCEECAIVCVAKGLGSGPWLPSSLARYVHHMCITNDLFLF